MSKEILLIRNDDGEFELYDDTYDVVIHCKNRQGMKETCEILRKVGTDEKAPNALLMDPVDMAIAIRNHCKSRTGGCEGCCFDRPTSDNGDGECVLGCPEDWEVRDRLWQKLSGYVLLVGRPRKRFAKLTLSRSTTTPSP